VRVGDFNADGALDLVIANLGRGDDPSTVKVLLGDDLGAFPTRPADVRVGRGAFAMAAGDINADGALDLVVANQWSDSVSLLFGDDRGGFSPAVDVHVGSGPDSIAVGYFDADDALDLAVANGGGDTISVLLGNGSGGFRLPHDFSVGHVPTSVVAKDFDGDGSIDLALLNAGDYPASGRVSILWGDNSGDFSAPVDFPVGIDADALAVGDFNTDGVPDLVVVNAGIYPGAGTVSLLLGNRSRGFAPRTDFPVGVSPVSVAVGDFNADRALDLAVSNFDSSFLTILFGDGTGDLPRSVDVHVGLERRSVVAADLNADGALDLAVANSSNSSVNVLLGLVGEGLGSFSPPMDFQVGNSPYSMAVGQFNADGVLDLAVLNAGVFPDANSTVSLLLNQLESRADTNGSNRIDGFDVARVNRLAGALASACDGNPACSYRRDADVDLNGVIDGDDLCLVASQFGKLRKDASPLHATLDVAPPVTPDVVSFHQAASEGDLLTLNILVDTDNAAAAADFAVTFEPAPGDLGRGQVLEYSGFVPGTFLAGGVGQAYSLDTSTPGEVKITVSRLPYGQDQVMSGLQPLLSLFLRARRDGEAVLEFAGRDDQTPPAILTASGRQVSVIFQGGARIAVASANSDARGQRIGAAPLPLDFGLVAIGSSTQRMLRISNFGFSELTVTGVVSELPEVTTLFSSAFTVPPFGFVELPVIFSPALDGLFSGDLVIASDDPTRPEFRVPMAGRTVYSLSVAP
jgi:hypothetical protein